MNIKGAETSVVGGKRFTFWVSLGENTMTVVTFVVFTYHENKLFLWHFWLGHLAGKTGDEREEK